MQKGDLRLLALVLIFLSVVLLANQIGTFYVLDTIFGRFNLAAVIDTMPPTTAIISPVNGQSITVPTINVTASASDDVGVVKVELWKNGRLAGTTINSPYVFNVPTQYNFDLNADGSVDAVDKLIMAQCQAHILTNTRCDINLDGSVDASDKMLMAQAQAHMLSNTVTLQTKAYDAVGNVGVSPVISVTAAPITAGNGLVGLWNLNGNANDSAGSSNGTLIGGPTWTIGKIGSGALQFDGVDDYATVADNGSPDLSLDATGKQTISLWAYKDNLVGTNSSYGLVSKGTGDTGFEYKLVASYYPNNHVDFYFKGFTLAGGTTGVDLYTDISGYIGQWINIVVKWDNPTATMYINGVSKATSVATTPFGNSPTPIDIGKNWSGDYANIAIDDLRIYNRALTDSEIEQIYTDGGGTLGPDTTQPIVSLNSIANLNALTGTVNLTATASDNVGVAGVKFYYNGINLIGAEDTTSPFGVSWDVTQLGGTYTLTAVARDDAGNTKTSNPVTVTITNPDTTPPVIFNPLPVGALSRSATTANLRVTTNENSTCKYGIIPNVAYASIAHTFSFTGGMTHSQTVSVSSNTTYHYYVRCEDQLFNDSISDTVITFVMPPPSPANQEIIDSSALIELPTSALWSNVVNFRPGDGEVVTTNPPVFSWLYRPNITNTNDANSYLFLFQAAYSISDLQNHTNLVVNVLTRSNLYNMLDHFTPGSTVYWRVGYLIDSEMQSNIPNGFNRDDISTTSLSLISTFQPSMIWGATRSFQIASSAITWNRGMLADDTYLNGKAGHPRIFFNNSDISGFSATTKSQPEWTKIKNYVDTTIANPQIWNSNHMYTLNWDSGIAIAGDAFVWQMTKDQKYLNNLSPTPQELLVSYAQGYIDSGALKEDMDTAGRGSNIYYIALAYDWLYNEMSTAQRAAVLNAIDLHSKWVMYGSTFSNGINGGCASATDPLDDPMHGSYPNGRRVSIGCSPYASESHEYGGAQISMLGAIAGYSESPTAKRLLDLDMNLIIGRPMYNTIEGISASGAYMGLYEDGLLRGVVIADSAFPEAHFENNPFIKTSGDWLDRIKPAGTETEDSFWGDAAGGGMNDWTYFGDALSRITGSGLFYEHYSQQKQIMDHFDYYSMSFDGITNFEKFAVKYNFQQIPSQIESSPLSKVFPVGGWAFGSSCHSYDPQCFKNGVGFVFGSRPMVSGSHNDNIDSSFELWSYGQTITENGNSNWYYNQNAANHNSVLINGAGVSRYVTTPIFGRIFAFVTSSPNASLPYVYVAGDTSNAYQYFPVGSASVGVIKANRHLVMVRNKYFIVYDDLETSQPAKFTQLNQILDDTLVVSSDGLGKYSYTKTRTSNRLQKAYPLYSYYCPTPLKVFVSQIAHTTDGKLNVDYRSGATGLSTNPINGQVIGDVSNRTQYCYLSTALDNGNCGDPRKNSIWVSNKDPQNSFNFMEVIYPKNPADSAFPDPVIERLDDYTARVTSPNGTVDVVSFNQSSGDQYGANLIIDTVNMTPLPIPDGGYGTTR